MMCTNDPEAERKNCSTEILFSRVKNHQIHQKSGLGAVLTLEAKRRVRVDQMGFRSSPTTAESGYLAFSSRKQTLASVQAPQGLLVDLGRRRESPAYQLWGVSDLVSWKNPVAKRLEATDSPGRLPQPSSILNNSDTLQS